MGKRNYQRALDSVRSRIEGAPTGVLGTHAAVERNEVELLMFVHRRGRATLHEILQHVGGNCRTISADTKARVARYRVSLLQGEFMEGQGEYFLVTQKGVERIAAHMATWRRSRERR